MGVEAAWTSWGNLKGATRPIPAVRRARISLQRSSHEADVRKSAGYGIDAQKSLGKLVFQVRNLGRSLA